MAKRCIEKTQAFSLKVSDSSEGAGVGAGGTPVVKFAVLARLEEVLTAAEVGMLVHGPVSLQDVAGEDVAVAEALLDRLTVVSELHRVALEVRAVVDAHPVRTTTSL